MRKQTKEVPHHLAPAPPYACPRPRKVEGDGRGGGGGDRRRRSSSSRMGGQEEEQQPLGFQ
eukprot:9488405-Pyramimonas_sp.AAC.1